MIDMNFQEVSFSFSRWEKFYSNKKGLNEGENIAYN